MGAKEPRFHGEVSAKSHASMSKIRGKDTSIEVTLRKALWAKGYRYRKNYKTVAGSPDIALTKYKLAIFCDSEFFHGWTVIHFWGKDILKNTDECVRVIEETIFDITMGKTSRQI